MCKITGKNTTGNPTEEISLNHTDETTPKKQSEETTNIPANETDEETGTNDPTAVRTRGTDRTIPVVRDLDADDQDVDNSVTYAELKNELVYNHKQKAGPDREVQEMNDELTEGPPTDSAETDGESGDTGLGESPESGGGEGTRIGGEGTEISGGPGTDGDFDILSGSEPGKDEEINGFLVPGIPRHRDAKADKGIRDASTAAAVFKNTGAIAGLGQGVFSVYEGAAGADKRFDSGGNFMDPDYTAENDTDKARFSEMKDFDDKARIHNGLFDTGTSLIGLGGNISQLFANSRQRKNTTNKRKKTALNYSTFSTILGTLGNASKAVAGGYELAGYPTNFEGAKADTVVPAAKTAALGFGLLGDAVGLIGSLVNKSAHKKLVDNLDAREIFYDDAADTAEKAGKAALKQKGLDPQAKKALRAQYKTLKARKYALAQARNIHDQKAGAYPKGLIGTFGSAFQAAGGISKLFSDNVKKTPWGLKMAGSFSIIGSALKGVEALASHFSNKRENAVKMQELNMYLNRKRDKVKQEARDKFPGRNVDTILTDANADRITMMRMGVNTELSNKDLSDAERSEAFKKLSLKRAMYIMESSDRDDILQTLGFEGTPTVEDVADALMGD